MSIDPRISLITLGVDDVERATAFYERLGWKKSAASQDGITFIQLKGTVLGLFGREKLAEDAVETIAGVRDVHNQLRVGPEGSGDEPREPPGDPRVRVA